MANPAPLKRLKRGSTYNLLNAGLKALQEHENETAEVVIVCEPESASLMMGGLHPRASLYERPVNIESAKKTHALFRQVGGRVGDALWPRDCPVERNYPSNP